MLDISVCSKPANQNADYTSEGVGFYKQENLMQACPSGFHPIEQAELANVSPANLIKILPAVRKYFENGIEKSPTNDNATRFWTFENYWNNIKSFSRVSNGSLLENDISNSNGKTLALPVYCAVNHEYARNGKDRFEASGCEETVNVEGFTVCTRPSELFQTYPAILASNGQYNYAHPITVSNHITDRWMPESGIFPKDSDNIICPDGFDFPDNARIVEAIRKSTQVSKPKSIVFVDRQNQTAVPAITQYKMS